MNSMTSPQQWPPTPTEIQVSTAFFPAARFEGMDGRPDLIIRTGDTVFFYVHSSVLRSKSSNDFAYLLPSLPFSSSGGSSSSYYDIPPTSSIVTPHPTSSPQTLLTIYVPETSQVINIVLHIAYSLPCTRFGPSIRIIQTALDALPKYGMERPPSTSDIWTLLVQHAPRHPLLVYSIAAAHEVDPVCVLVSQHTLSQSLAAVSEADALNIGTSYLRRLVLLHEGRQEELKSLLRPLPPYHHPTTNCTNEDQESFRTAWSAAITDLLLSKPLQDMSVTQLSNAFFPIIDGSTCNTCIEGGRKLLEDLVDEWAKVQRTI